MCHIMQFLVLMAAHGVMMVHEKNHMCITLFSQGVGGLSVQSELEQWEYLKLPFGVSLA